MSSEIEAIITTARIDGIAAGVAAGWRILSQFDDYNDLDPLVDVLTLLATSFPPSADLTILRGATYQKRCEWAFASDLLSTAAPEFPDRADLHYEAALNSIDAGYYARAEALLERLASGVDSHPDRILRGMWRAAALIGRHDIASAAFAAASAASSPYAEPQLVFRMRAATAIQEAVRRCGVEGISIGENCLPWMLLNRWGLRTYPTSARADSIFNLAQTSTDGCVSILADLASLIAPEELEVARNSNGAPLPVNRRRRIDFNHEQGRWWVENNFAKLRERYVFRIQNLLMTMDEPQRLYVHYTEGSGDINALLRVLSSINRGGVYRVLIIDTAANESRLSATAGYPEADYIHLRLPRPDYIWFRPDDLDSADGVAFEWRIATAVLQSLDKLLGREVLDISKLKSVQAVR